MLSGGGGGGGVGGGGEKSRVSFRIHRLVT
jgi:hypothetical protein